MMPLIPTLLQALLPFVESLTVLLRREAKVHHVCGHVVVKENVARLQVIVDKRRLAMVVQVVKSPRDVEPDVHPLRHSQSPPPQRHVLWFIPMVV